MNAHSNFVIFAEKKNFRQLINFSKNITVIPSKYSWLSILRNPVGFESSEWLNVITPLFGGFDLRFPGINYIRSIIEESNNEFGFTGSPSQPCPSLDDIVKHSYSKKLRLYSERQKYKERAEDRLASIVRSSGKIFKCHYGLNLDKLLTQNVVIELYGLYPAIKRLIISTILSYIYYSKLTARDPVSNNHTCIMIDEGQEVFRRSLELNELMPFTDRFVSIAREQNISVITGTQIFNDLSLNVRMNSATKIACGFSDKIEQSHFCNSIGITDKARIQQLNKELSPGRALVASHKYPHPFLIDVPFLGMEQNIPDKVILMRLLSQSDSIYHKNDAERVKLDLRSELGIIPEDIILLPPVKHQSSNHEIDNGHVTSRIEKCSYYDETLALVEYMIRNKKQFCFYSEILELLNITSGSKKTRIKETAIKMGWAKEHKLQIKRNLQIILELLDPAYKLCKSHKPTFSSKGGFLHQFMCQRIKGHLKRIGYKVKVEFFLSNNKAVDLVAEKENQLLFIEIANSKVESLQNIIDDLSTPLKPTSHIICCRDSKLRNTQNELLKSSEELKKYHDKIMVSLAGELIDLHQSRKELI